MNNVILADLIESVEEQKLQVLNVVVRRGGKIIARHDFIEEQPHLLWSVSKTFTSMAVGIAIEEGYFKLTDYLVDFFDTIPEEYMSENLKLITIHDLLCMGTGHAYCPVFKFDWEKNPKGNIEQLFFEEPIVYKPGTHFIYDNSSAYMLSRILTLATGKPLDDYLDMKIFQPLDIPKPKWDKSPQGVVLGFSGLHLTATDLSKFGQLLLDNGMWQGQQLIPTDYLKKATSVQSDTSKFNPFYATEDHHQGYGYQLWMNAYPNSYRLDGLNGQYVVVLPDKNAVVTYVSNEPKKMMKILELTWETLVDKL